MLKTNIDHIETLMKTYYAPRKKYMNKADVVKLLIERKANLEHKGRKGETPLFWAAKTDKLDICKMLVEAKADVTVRSTENKTAADLAKEKGNNEVYKFLEQA